MRLSAFVLWMLIGVPATSAVIAANGPAARQTPAAPHHDKVPPSRSQAMDAAAVLARYRTNIAMYRTPPIMSFTYTIDQVGDHGLSQTHLMYRSGLMVRDETIALGSMHVRPHIHIYRSRVPHYAVENVAPREPLYQFAYLGTHSEGSEKLYDYLVSTPRKYGFIVTKVSIDGTRCLPAAIDFRTRNGAMQGEGTLRYAAADDAWVITEAAAAGHGMRHALREHLVFSDYHFPGSLPPATFGLPSL